MSVRPGALPIWITTVVSLIVAGCGGTSEPTGGGTTPPGPPATVAKQGGDNQSAAAGAAVSTAPSVKVSDAQGKAVPGVSVTFAVASGGGAVAGATVATNGSGIATVGGWTLGTGLGANTLSATATGVATAATFTATAVAGPAATLTKTGGDNQTVPPSTAVPVAPSVLVVDQHGNPVPGNSVTFAVATGGGTVTGATVATDAAGQATVGSWTLGAGAGAQTLTATATGAGITGNPATFTATAQLNPLQPAADTTISGTLTVASVLIGAGVTVTVAGDLVLNVTGNATINGTIKGDCVAMTLNIDGTAALAGGLANDCAVLPDDDPPELNIVALGGFTSTGTMTTSGDFNYTDDPTITDPELAPVGFPAGAARADATGGAPCLSWGGSPLQYSPPKARNGASGKDGANGRRGRTATARCRGDIQLNGAMIIGQDGGDGGNGTASASNGPTATGGDGGDGGKVVLRSAGSVFGSGTIRGGRGGNGGDATTSGIKAKIGPKASSATATAGNGGMSGLVEVRGREGIAVTLTIDVQPGGAGGEATATGAEGYDADATDPAQEGGNGFATGGRGGDAPDKMLSSNKEITGVTLTGGNGGDGGVADATGGKGGNGNRMFKSGAKGGNMTGTGGGGGDALLKNLVGAPVGMGGMGADAFFRRGIGGDGYNDCFQPLTSGGPGGVGGTAAGKPGSGGTGTPPGADGKVKASDAAGNGGAGGSGYGPAMGGAGGADTRTGGKEDTPPVFMKGPDGAGCVVETTWVTNPTDDPEMHDNVLQIAAEPHDINVLRTDDMLDLGVVELFGLNLSIGATLTGNAFSGSGGVFIHILAGRSGTVTVMGTIDPDAGTFTARFTLTPTGLPPVTYTVTGMWPPEVP